MCGIIGITESNKELIERAAACFAYRGPDAHMFYADDRVSVGHHRLSIIDVDERSNQPMWTADRTLCVVFNGEIYNHKELRKELEKKGHSFATASDTEVLLYAYREYGQDFARRLSGMYAFALYDVRQKKILLYRDHAGIKPLYYSYHNGVLLFASELKGIARMWKGKGWNLIRNEKALKLYEVFGYIPSPETLYENIYKLPKSSFLAYDIDAEKKPSIANFKTESAVINTREGLESAVEQKILDHLIADVSVGLFFSGGTDSSLIAAILQKHGINLEAFSVKVDGRPEDEKYFEAIDKKLGLRAHAYDFTVREFDDIYERVMRNIDEPSYDNSIFPTCFVSRKAAERVKVVLSGEGGDEYFLGYPRHKILASMSRLDQRITLMDRLFFIMPRMRGKNLAFEKIFAFMRQPISYYLLTMSPAKDLASLDSWRAAKQAVADTGASPLEFDQALYLENDLLKKTDQATSYASIEGRVPLLDPAITSNAWRFNSQHIQDGILKSVLKGMLAHFLPHDLVYRKKTGFGMNLISFFEKSAFLKNDFEQAASELFASDILKKKIAGSDGLIRRYPNYCFALISLWRALNNNEKG